MKLILCLQINVKVSSNIYYHFRCVCQINQNNKFPISFQCLKKEVSDEVDLLHVDKHKSFLQVKTMILIRMVKYCQSSQNSKFAMSLQYLKKEVRGEVEFFKADKRQNFQQVDFNTLGIIFSYKVILSLLKDMIKHS